MGTINDWSEVCTRDQMITLSRSDVLRPPEAALTPLPHENLNWMVRVKVG